jgi:hypothetical protein
LLIFQPDRGKRYTSPEYQIRGLCQEFRIACDHAAEKEMTKTPVQVRFEPAEREALDNYRRQQANPPSRAQAARDLICLALSERGGNRRHRRRAGKLASPERGKSVSA